MSKYTATDNKTNMNKWLYGSLLVGSCAILLIATLAQAQYNTYDSDSNSGECLVIIVIMIWTSFVDNHCLTQSDSLIIPKTLTETLSCPIQS